MSAQIASASINQPLTAFAIGYMNDAAVTEMLSLSERLAPSVRVPASQGSYKIFNEKNGMVVYDTSRPLGGDVRRIDFGATDGTFNCKPHGLEVTVDVEEVNQAGPSNAVAQQLLDTGKIKAVLNAAVLAHTKAVVDLAAAVSAESSIGVWSGADVDPIDQIDSVLDSISKAVGSTMFLKVTMDLTSWRTLRSHPKVKARTTGVQVAGISIEQLRGMFAIPCEPAVHAISYDTTKEGQTASKSRLGASSVFVHYAVPNPTVYDVSGFKVFTVGDRMVQDVRTWEAQNGLYRAHQVLWSRDIKQTSTLAFKRIAIS